LTRRGHLHRYSERGRGRDSFTTPLAKDDQLSGAANGRCCARATGFRRFLCFPCSGRSIASSSSVSESCHRSSCGLRKCCAGCLDKLLGKTSWSPILEPASLSKETRWADQHDALSSPMSCDPLAWFVKERFHSGGLCSSPSGDQSARAFIRSTNGFRTGSKHLRLPLCWARLPVLAPS
jgi:hypothetical protein